ncbi:hypothetical protein E3P89_01671 [Wallemia ichthyophaga]|uniref:3'-5' exonuclease domain-containing protein n=1 Tax=Wallemia ichthyophaga TaxID=245174 RepID=A0A4T0HQ99_WALIC|nr:hypothetical protein E3P93_01823 [Wallemia ichthyophaga]TIB16962.1 hypothetical protein E3P90_00249 [Wallemia ichthyophaga]TIB23197.1 hypothetical protein E3P89_01671 [Wallemia ichthyophaga]TIB27244.1 hypothetical protein E3P88_00249 [Wallemia ichthyophaga]
MNLIRRLSNDKIIDLTGGFTGVATTPPNPNPPADYRNKTLQSTPRKASKPPIKPSVTPLPLYSYTRPPSFSNKGLKAPGIAYTRSLEEADDLISLLRGPVGFDMEWKVDFRKNARQRPTALVQVSVAIEPRKADKAQICDDKLIVILHLYHMPKLPQELIKLLTNKDIIKVGVNIGNDGRKFFNDYKVQCKGLLELTFLAKSIHAEDLGTNKVLISLDKLTEYVLKQRLDKGNERVGDWESFLDWKQIEYAANDVYAGYQMYKRLSEQSKDTDYSNFLVEKDYETGLIKETPNNAANNTKPIPTTSDTHIRNSISNKVKYNTANRSIEREGTRITSLQPRHLKAIKAYFHDELSLDDTRKSLRPEKPLAQITVAIYVTEALLLTKEGYSDAMLNRLNSDLRYLNENVRKAWYEDVGSLID